MPPISSTASPNAVPIASPNQTSSMRTADARSQSSAHVLSSDEVWRDMFLTRLPIFDADRQTVGYELLAQSPPSNTSLQNDNPLSADDVSDTAMLTRQSIHHALHVIGLDQLACQARLFIPMTTQNMLDEDFNLLPAAQTCLNLKADQPPNADLLGACQRARQIGYTLAVAASDLKMIDAAWLDLAHILRVNLTQAAADDVKSLIQQHTQDGSQNGLQLLAIGIDTLDDMDKAKTLGVNLLQGDFFCQPQTLQGKELASTQITQLKFLAQLNEPTLDFDKLEETIKCDLSLTCNLLRYMNSAAMGIKTRITSVKQAMVLLGEKPMRQWGSLIAITALGSAKPHELLVTCLVRARFCETLAKKRAMDQHTLDLFLTGLLSTLDVMLDTTMDKAINTLPLTADVRRVLTGERTSEMGQIFTLACAAQRGAWGSVIELANQLQLTHHEIASLYYQTLQWTHSFFSTPSRS